MSHIPELIDLWLALLAIQYMLMNYARFKKYYPRYNHGYFRSVLSKQILSKPVAVLAGCSSCTLFQEITALNLKPISIPFSTVTVLHLVP